MLGKGHYPNIHILRVIFKQCLSKWGEDKESPPTHFDTNRWPERNCLWLRWFRQKRKEKKSTQVLCIQIQKAESFLQSVEDWWENHPVCIFSESSCTLSSFGFSVFLLFLELHLLIVLDPAPKTQQDVFFSWYLIVTSYMDLGKGSGPPEIRPVCVLGDGNGENNFCLLEAS